MKNGVDGKESVCHGKEGTNEKRRERRVRKGVKEKERRGGK